MAYVLLWHTTIHQKKKTPPTNISAKPKHKILYRLLKAVGVSHFIINLRKIPFPFIYFFLTCDLYCDTSRHRQKRLFLQASINQQLNIRHSKMNSRKDTGPRGNKKSRTEFRDSREIFRLEEPTAIPESIRRYRDDIGKIISAEDFVALQNKPSAELNFAPVPEHASKLYAQAMESHVIYSDQIYIAGIQARLNFHQAYADIGEILASQDIDYCPMDLTRALQQIRSINSGGNVNHSITLLLKQLYVFKTVPNIMRGEKRICQLEFGRVHSFKSQHKSYSSAVAEKGSSGVQYVITAVDRHFNSTSACTCAALTNGSWDEDVLSQQLHGAHVFFSKILGLIANYYEISVVPIPFWAPVSPASPESGFYRCMVIAVMVVKNTYSAPNVVIKSEGISSSHLAQWWTELGFMAPTAENSPDVLVAPIAGWSFTMVKNMAQVRQCPIAPNLSHFFHTAPSIRIDTVKNTKLSDIIEVLQLNKAFPSEEFLFACVQQMWIPRFLRKARSYGDVFWIYFSSLQATELPMWALEFNVNGVPLEICRADSYESPGSEYHRALSQKSYDVFRERRMLPHYLKSQQYNFISCSKMLIYGPHEYMISLIGESAMETDGSDESILGVIDSECTIGAVANTNDGIANGKPGFKTGASGRSLLPPPKAARQAASPPFNAAQFALFVKSQQAITPDACFEPVPVVVAPVVGIQSTLEQGSTSSSACSTLALRVQPSPDSSVTSSQLVRTPQSHMVSSGDSSYESLVHIDGKFDVMMHELLKMQTHQHHVELQLKNTLTLVEELRKEVRLGTQVAPPESGDHEPMDFIYTCPDQVFGDNAGADRVVDVHELDQGLSLSPLGGKGVGSPGSDVPAPPTSRKSSLPVAKRNVKIFGESRPLDITKSSVSDKISSIMDASFSKRAASMYAEEVIIIRSMLGRIKAASLLGEFLMARKEISQIKAKIDRGEGSGMAIGIIPYLLKVIMFITSEGPWPPEPLRSLQKTMLGHVSFTGPSMLGGDEGLYMQLPNEDWGKAVDSLLYCGTITVRPRAHEIPYAQQLPRKWFDKFNKFKQMDIQRFLIGDRSSFLPMANFNFAILNNNQLAFDTKGYGGIDVVNSGFDFTAKTEVCIIYDPNRSMPFIQQLTIRMMASNLWRISDMCSLAESHLEAKLLQQVAEQLMFDQYQLPADWHYVSVDDIEGFLQIVDGDVGAITQWARGHFLELSPWLQTILNGKDRQIFDDCAIIKEGGSKFIRDVLPVQHSIRIQFGLVEHSHPLYEIAWADEIILETQSDHDSDYEA